MPSSASAEICRLIIDEEPAPGAWNMAVDEALLDSAVAGGSCTVRWYRWDRPTLSLGYFQAPETVSGDPRLAGLPVVRRLTGGGAIVHHFELTYSCTLAAGHRLARNTRQLYLSVHEQIIRVLGEFGFAANLRGVREAGRAGNFLCFARGDDFDVVMGENKVLGSAQRRRKGAVLQHGSLLLRQSSSAGGFPGVFDCGGQSVPETDLLQQFSRNVAEVFSHRVEIGSLTADEHRRAAQLIDKAK
jgi:lipoate-protein ligase A